jgi:hypothetical protein
MGADQLRQLVSRFRSSSAFAAPRYELRNRKDTSKPMILVPLLNPKFATRLVHAMGELRVRGTSGASKGRPATTQRPSRVPGRGEIIPHMQNDALTAPGEGGLNVPCNEKKYRVPAVTGTGGNAWSRRSASAAAWRRICDLGRHGLLDDGRQILDAFASAHVYAAPGFVRGAAARVLAQHQSHSHAPNPALERRSTRLLTDHGRIQPCRIKTTSH